MSKSFELPEDKELEVARLLQKLEKQKQESVKQAKALEEKATSDKEAEQLASTFIPKATQALDNFIKSVTKHSAGAPITVFEKDRPKLSDLFRNKFKHETTFGGKPVVRYIGHCFKEHPGIFLLHPIKRTGKS